MKQNIMIYSVKRFNSSRYTPIVVSFFSTALLILSTSYIIAIYVDWCYLIPFTSNAYTPYTRDPTHTGTYWIVV